MIPRNWLGLFILTGILWTSQATEWTEQPCEFQCRNSTTCLTLEKLRDGTPDCPDASDEECKEGEHACRAGLPLCIPASMTNDNVIDCEDGSDEGCKEGWFICNDRSDCIPPHMFQDEVVDCDDESDERCYDEQHECLCGSPRCLDPEFVGDGVNDCQEGSDEIPLDKSTYICPEDGHLQTIERSRKKRQALPSFATTMFVGLSDPFRVKPTGVISSSVGSFIQDGTTTEYVTEIMGTYIGNKYAKIISTSSRVFYAIPTRNDDMLDIIRPTGLVSSTTSTEINGDATTEHTTEYYRSHVDSTYVQMMRSSSNVHFPPWYTDPIIPSTHEPLDMATKAPVHTVTPVHQGMVEEEDVMPFVVPSYDAPGDNGVITRLIPSIKPTPYLNGFPTKVKGNFAGGNDLVKPTSVAQIQFAKETPGNVIVVTGTHGQFINKGLQPTTYNVFTGSYVSSHKTYLFFFGNTALDRNSKRADPEITVHKTGSQSKIVVDMEKKLELIVPTATFQYVEPTEAPEMILGTGEIEGEMMAGMIIEDSEGIKGFQVAGAHGNGHQPHLSSLTVTVDSNSKNKLTSERTVYHFEREEHSDLELEKNIIPRARQVGDGEQILVDIQPSSATNTFKPVTFTVGDGNGGVREQIKKQDKKKIESMGQEFEDNVDNMVEKMNLREDREFKGFHVREEENELLQGSESAPPTVTYVGFVEFTTSIAGTHVVFLPKSIYEQRKLEEEMQKTEAPFLEPSVMEDLISSQAPDFQGGSKGSMSMEKVTNTKFFYSQSPGMMTETVQGHKVAMDKMETVIVDSNGIMRTTKAILLSPTSVTSEVVQVTSEIQSVVDKEDKRKTFQIDAEIYSQTERPTTEAIIPEEPTTKEEEITTNHVNTAQPKTDSSSENPIVLSSSEGTTPKLVDDKEFHLHIEVPKEEAVDENVPDFSTVSTLVFNTVDLYPTGLITSIGGTIARHGTTTVFSTNIFGTFLGNNYAQIVQSTSSIYYLQDENSEEAATSPYTSSIITSAIDQIPEQSIDITPTVTRTTPKYSELVRSRTTEKEYEYDPYEIFDNQLHKPTPEDNRLDPPPVNRGRAVGSRAGEQKIVDTSGKHISKEEPPVKPLPTVPEPPTTEGDRGTTEPPTTEEQSFYIEPSPTIPEETKKMTGVGRPTTSYIPEPYEEIYETPTTEVPLASVLSSFTSTIIKTVYTTYTFFTTLYIDGRTILRTSTEVVSNTVTSTEIFATLNSPFTAFTSPAPVSDNPPVSSVLAQSPLPYAELDTAETKQPVPSEGTTESISSLSTDSDATTESVQPEGSLSDTEDLSAPKVFLKTYTTTYTFWTTSYLGKGSSKVVSREETETNVVSDASEETVSYISPTQPLTYYTTFTYETTSYKGNSTIISSREETVTNVVTPDFSLTTPLPPSKEEIMSSPTYYSSISPHLPSSPAYSSPTPSYSSSIPVHSSPTLPHSSPIPPTSSDLVIVSEEVLSSPSLKPTTPSYDSPFLQPLPSVNESQPVSPTYVVTPDSSLTSQTETTSDTPIPISTSKPELTTYYTTFSYFTTSYTGNSSIVQTRLETVTNVVTGSIPATYVPTPTNAEGKQPDQQVQKTVLTSPVGLLSTASSTETHNGIETVHTEAVYGVSKDGTYHVITSASSDVITPTPTVQEPKRVFPTGLVSLNIGSTVYDASTIHFTTKAIGTYVGDLYAQVLESTSSIEVDSSLDALKTEEDLYRTGLVSSVAGYMVKNGKTTVYESQIIGTYIDGLYAQIVQSTYSFPSSPAATASPSLPSDTKAGAPASTIVTAPDKLQSSFEEPTTEATTPDEDIEEATEPDDGRVRSRLRAPKRTRTFTPLIRPFSARTRPTFIPAIRRRQSVSAATITRPNVRPTVTATPALTSPGSQAGDTTSATRRFGVSRTAGFRVRGSSPGFARGSPTSPGFQSTPGFRIRGGASSPGFGATRTRGRFFPTSRRGFISPSATIQPTASASPGFVSRRGGYRGSRPGRQTIVSKTENRFGTTGSSVFPTISSRFGFRQRSSILISPSPTIDTITNEVDKPHEPKEDEGTRGAAPRLKIRPNRVRQPSVRTRNRFLLRRNRLRRPEQIVTEAPPTEEQPLEETHTPEETPTDGGVTDSGVTQTTEGSFTIRRPPRLDIRPATRRNRPRNSLFSSRSFLERLRGRRRGSSRAEASPNNDDELVPEGSEPIEVVETAEVLQRKKRQTPPEYGLRNRGRARFIPSRPRSQSIVEDEPAPPPPVRRNRRPSRIRATAAQRKTPFTLTPNKANNDEPKQRRNRVRRPNLRLSSQNNNDNINERRPQRQRKRFGAGRRVQGTKSPRRFGNERPRNRFRRPTSTRVKPNRFQDYETSDLDYYSYDNSISSVSDGTITVTHKIPTSATVPFVNDGRTEYKEIITASDSLEVIQPHQYTPTEISGTMSIFLSEITNVPTPGITEVTSRFLSTSVTEGVIFTPTIIRGRRTSASHITPSTVYEVQDVVATVKDDADSPLAGLLSQLLLGQLGGNPLGPNPLGALGALQPAVKPSTTYKIETSIYVTTITEYSSRILPIIFRGKKIETTVINTETNVITATELSTIPVVITPTKALNPLNSLLLPALLQSQLLQAQLGQVGLPSNPQPAAIQPNNFNEEPPFDIIFTNEPDIPTKPTKAFRPKSRPTKHKFEQPFDFEHEFKEEFEPEVVAPDPVETSVITRYVSGRRPGEFSSILSTITLSGGEATRRKREADPYIEVRPSVILPNHVLKDEPNYDDLDAYIAPATDEIESNFELFEPTQSLESIIGDVSKHVNELAHDIKPSQVEGEKTDGKHFLENGAAETVPLKRRMPRSAQGLNARDPKLILHFDAVSRRTDPLLHFSAFANFGKRLPHGLQQTSFDQERSEITRPNSQDLDREGSFQVDNAPIQQVQQPSQKERRRGGRRRVVVTRKRVIDPSSPPSVDHGHQVIDPQDVPKYLPREPLISVEDSPTYVGAPEVNYLNRRPRPFRGRKRIIVTRKRPIAPVTQAPTFSENFQFPKVQDENLQPEITPAARKIPDNQDVVAQDVAPSFDDQSFRTQYTIYSYLFTILAQGSAPLYSNREVTISEVVDEKQSPLPAGFVLTKGPNGASLIKEGSSVVNLGQRVNGISTTFINLASTIIAQYNTDDKPLPQIRPTQTLATNVEQTSIVQQDDEPQDQRKRIRKQKHRSRGTRKFSDYTSTFQRILPSKRVTRPRKTKVLVSKRLFVPSKTVQPEITPTSAITDSEPTVIDTYQDESSEPPLDPSLAQPSQDFAPTLDPQTEAAYYDDDYYDYEYPQEYEYDYQYEEENTEPISTEDRPRFIRPTRFEITTKSYDFRNRLKQIRTVSHVVVPSRTFRVQKPGRTRGKYVFPRRTKVSSAILPSNVIFSTYSTVSLLPIRTGKDITLTYVTSSLVTLDESKLQELLASSTESVSSSTVLPVQSPSVIDENALDELVTSVSESITEPIFDTGSTSTQPTTDDKPAAIRPSPASDERFQERTLEDHVRLVDGPAEAQQVSNQGLLSSIRSATAEFLEKTYLTTFTLWDDNSPYSSRTEVIANVVTEEVDRVSLEPTPILATSSFIVASGFNRDFYRTLTYQTTYTYFNTFIDGTQPVVLTSKETVSNVVTLPAQAYTEEEIKPSSTIFDTSTYMTTYTFSKTDYEGGSSNVKTMEEVITQVVVTERPQAAAHESSVNIEPTTSEIVKTYLNTVTYLNTAVVGGETVTTSELVISSDVVTETVVVDGAFYSPDSSQLTTPFPESTTIFPTPVLQPSSSTIPQEEVDESKVLLATYITTSTFTSTILKGDQTLFSTRTEVTSNIVTKPISQGLDSEYLSYLKSSIYSNKESIKPTPTDDLVSPTALPTPTYIQLAPNVFGQIRTIETTYVYSTTLPNGQVSSSEEIVTQVTTSLVRGTDVPLGVFPGYRPSSIESSVSSVSLGSKYLSSLKSTFISSFTPATPSSTPSSILTSDFILPESVIASHTLTGTKVVTDSISSATIVIKPSPSQQELHSPHLTSSFIETVIDSGLNKQETVPGDNVITGSTIIFFDTGHLNSLKSSYESNLPSSGIGGSTVIFFPTVSSLPEDTSSPTTEETGSTDDGITTVVGADNDTKSTTTSESSTTVGIPEEIPGFEGSIPGVQSDSPVVAVVPPPAAAPAAPAPAPAAPAAAPPSSSSGGTSSISGTVISGGDIGGISGGLGSLGNIFNMGTLGTAALTGLSGLASGGAGGNLNINLGPMIDAVAGIISNSFVPGIRRNDSKEEVRKPPVDIPQVVAVTQNDPLFIPVGGVAASLNREDVGPTDLPQPPVYIPLNRKPTINVDQHKPPSGTIRPAIPVKFRPGEGIPIRPGQFFDTRPDEDVIVGRPHPGVSRPAQPFGIPVIPGKPLVHLPGEPVPIQFGRPQPVDNFRPPLPQSGFTGVGGGGRIDPTKVSVISGAETILFSNINLGNLPPPGQPNIPPRKPVQPFPIGPNNIDRVIIEHNRPNDGIISGASTIFFDPNGRPEPPSLITLETRLTPPDRRPVIPVSFSETPAIQWPAVQTIASIQGNNKIVATNVINTGPFTKQSEEAPDLIQGGQSKDEGIIIKPTFVQSSLEHPSEQGSDQNTPELNLSTSVVTGIKTIFINPHEEKTSVHTKKETTAVGDKQTVVSGATTIFGSLFTKPLDKLDQAGSEATQYVTATETVMHTVTATETTVVFSRGKPVTNTLVFTTTIPPRTVVSTIVGSKTTINTIGLLATQLPTQDSWPSSSNGRPVQEKPPTTQGKINTRPETATTSGPSDTKTTPRKTFVVAGVPVIDIKKNEIERAEEKDNKISLRGGHDDLIIEAVCVPSCSSAKQEVCKNARCVCQPGFARMYEKEKCEPTKTYSVKVLLEQMAGQVLEFSEEISTKSSPRFQRLAAVAEKGVNKALMDTPLRNNYHGATVMSIIEKPREISDPGVVVDFTVQLSEKSGVDDAMLHQTLSEAIAARNRSLGETNLVAGRRVTVLRTEDFNECAHLLHHDCSDQAFCVNQPGTYTCQCRDGYEDLELNGRPGRACAAKSSGCEQCNYHGECMTYNDGSQGCECYRWYTGNKCQVNLKVLLIVLCVLGALLLVLLTVCVIMCCRRNRSTRASVPLLYGTATTSTLDRQHMLRETGSDSSDQGRFGVASTLERRGKSDGAPSFVGDRSLRSGTTIPPVVQIPRVKYPGTSPTRRTSNSTDPNFSATESQLMGVLDGDSRNPSRTSRSAHNTVERSLKVQNQRRGSMGAVAAAGSRSRSRSSEAITPQGRSSGMGDRTVSEARSYDETTVRNVTRNPLSLYSSRITSEGGPSEDAEISKRKLYKPMPESDNQSEMSFPSDVANVHRGRSAYSFQ